MKNKFIPFNVFKTESAGKANLYKNLWKENTTALLHAPRATDKTSLALDIVASVVASGREVIYVNTAHSLDSHVDRAASISGLLVFTPEYESPDDTADYADLVISGIEEAVATTSVRTFVIDSVTRIAALSFGRNASASYVMKRLMALQVRCGLSLLVISHDSTKATDRTLVCLADSEIVVDQPAESVDQLAEISVVTETLPVTHITPITRQQRRALEREQRKSLSRNRL